MIQPKYLVVSAILTTNPVMMFIWWGLVCPDFFSAPDTFSLLMGYFGALIPIVYLVISGLYIFNNFLKGQSDNA